MTVQHSTADAASSSEIRLLFLHGLESGPQGAKYQALKAAFGDVLAPDCSGIGDEGARLRIIQGKLERQPASYVVVGSSMGGLMALLLWRALPQRIAGLVLCAPALQRPAARNLDLDRLPATRVIHGRHDRVVPLRYSRPFGQRLLIVDDDHSLKHSLPQIVAATADVFRELAPPAPQKQ